MSLFENILFIGGGKAVFSQHGFSLSPFNINLAHPSHPLVHLGNLRKSLKYVHITNLLFQNVNYILPPSPRLKPTDSMSLVVFSDMQ